MGSQARVWPGSELGGGGGGGQWRGCRTLLEKAHAFCTKLTLCYSPGCPKDLLVGHIAGQHGPAPQIHEPNELQNVEGRETRREKGTHPGITREVSAHGLLPGLWSRSSREQKPPWKNGTLRHWGLQCVFEELQILSAKGL